MLTGDDVGLTDIPSLASTVFTRLEDCYYDPRTENRPSKFVRTFLGSPGSTSTVTRNSDGTRCAIAGKEALKIVRILEAPGVSQGETIVASSRRSLKFLAKGVGGAQLIEDLNLWSHARPAASYSITDASWGFGPYSNKIVTSCASGDVLLWDITKTKLEKNWREEHLRAVNKILFVPSNPHVFLTGSQDTHVKIWDMRAPNALRLSLAHSTAVRALCMPPSLPSSSSTPLSHPSSSHQALVALEGGDLIRWDLRAVGSGGGRMPMDKVPVAHRGAILGIDWTVSTGEDGKGWVCTGGQDRTVKIWDMSQPTLSSIPQHTLHTPHPVKRVKWRPESNTEIAVVPRTIGISPFGFGVPPASALPRSGSMTRTTGISSIFAASSSDDASVGNGGGGGSGGSSGGGLSSAANIVTDADRIEIWDVRRHYVSKYVLLGSEGAVSDAVWTGPDSLCAAYKNGCFTRHDVHHSYAPLDYMPRHAVTWDPMGGITFVTGKKQPGTIPFDDMLPAAVTYHRIPPKTPVEPPFEPSQVAAFFPGPIADTTDLGVFRTLARNYVFSGDTPINMCIHNSAAALEAEDYIAVQMWDRLKGLLTDPDPLFADSPSLSPVRQRSASRSVLSSISFANTNTKTNANSSPLSQTNSRGPERGHKRRTSSIGPMSPPTAQSPSSRYRNVSLTTKQQQPSRSSSRDTSPASPHADLRRRNGIISPTINPSASSTSSHAIPSTPAPSNLTSSAPSRSRSSPRPSRGSGGRGNRSTHSRETSTSGARSRSLSLGSAAALLALQDDSGSGDESDQEKESDHDPPASPLVLITGNTLWRSPLSQTLAVAGSPSPDQSDSGFPPRVLNSSVPAPVQSTPFHPDSPPDSEASEDGAEADDNYYSSTSPENDSPMLQPANGRDGKLSGDMVATQSRVTNSIEPYLASLDEIPNVSLPRQFSETSILTAVPTRRLGVQSTSPLRPSQDRTSPGSSSRHTSSGAPNLSLSRADQGAGVRDEVSNSIYAQTEPDHIRDRGRRRRRANVDINAAQMRFWDLGWTSFRGRVEEEIENGNIQLASALAVVGGERVVEDRLRVEQLSTAYVELLSRLRLHTSAALVRKSSEFDGLKEPTMLDTVNHMSCGSCHKAFLGSFSGSRNAIKPGQYQYCTNCRESKARCSICRLPVLGLLFFCQMCAHGGHQECYRSYLLARPLVEAHTPGFAGQFRGRSLPRQPRLSNSSVHSTQASMNEWQQQQQGGADSHAISGTASLAVTEEDEGTNIHRTFHSSGNSSWGIEKRRLRYHPCPTGCGHHCWAANDAS